jgi:hypothetical protein
MSNVGGNSRLIYTANKLQLYQMLVAVNVPSSLILSTLVIQAIRSSETSVLTSATRRHIQKDGILHSHRRGNLNSYIALTGWTL